METDFVTKVVQLIAQQNGFLAEVKARLWVYKGVTFQQLPKIFTDQFAEYFLNDLGLL